MALQPHFFKAYSHIGILFPPKNYNLQGVFNAPDHIISETFLNKFVNKKIDSYTFYTSENLFTKAYVKDLTTHLLSFSKFLNKKCVKRETQVVVGGDNCVSFSSLLSLFSRYKIHQIGYIQFDSHGELNSFSNSPSKNFHGMYMRPFLDKFDIQLINELIPEKMKSEQMLFFGDQDLDIEEKEFMIKKSLKIFSSYYLKTHLNKTFNFIQSFIKKFDHIHVNIDIDFFHRSIASATGFPSKRGFMFSEIKQIFDILKTSRSMSVDLTEINSAKHDAAKTIKLGQKVLQHILT